MSDLTCFKAYDIRGRLGINLDEDIAYRIGTAFAVALGAEEYFGLTADKITPRILAALDN